MVESAPTERRRLSPARANPVAAAISASKPVCGVRLARRAVAICEGMAMAASVRPARMSGPRSRGRQPAKDRRTQERPALAAKASVPGSVTSVPRPRAAEALSIVLRAHPLEPNETSPHCLLRAEPAARRDPLGGQASLGEELAGRLDPQPLDRARGR